MILKENEICQFCDKCPYNINNSCCGTKQRNTIFNCNYIKEDGTFNNEGKVRNKFDKTGSMKILTENNNGI